MKKLIALVLTLAMLFALAACGADTNDTPTYAENAVSIPSTTGDYDIPAVFTVPEGEGPFPLVVMIHGFGGSKEENIGFTYIARVLAKSGIASMRFDCPGCGESKADYTLFSYSENVNNSYDCLNYALENANIDKNQLGILGYSMGGAATNIVTSREDSPYSVRVLLAPAYELHGMYESAPEQLKEAEENGYSIVTSFGTDYHCSAQFFEDLINYVDNREKVLETSDISTLVIYGTEDTTVPTAETAAFAEALHADSLCLDGVPHSYGFYNGPDGYETMDTIATSVTGFFYTRLTEDNAEAMFGE